MLYTLTSYNVPAVLPAVVLELVVVLVRETVTEYVQLLMLETETKIILS